MQQGGHSVNEATLPQVQELMTDNSTVDHGYNPLFRKLDIWRTLPGISEQTLQWVASDVSFPFKDAVSVPDLSQLITIRLLRKQLSHLVRYRLY